MLPTPNSVTLTKVRVQLVMGKRPSVHVHPHFHVLGPGDIKAVIQHLLGFRFQIETTHQHAAFLIEVLGRCGSNPD